MRKMIDNILLTITCMTLMVFIGCGGKRGPVANDGGKSEPVADDGGKGDIHVPFPEEQCLQLVCEHLMSTSGHAMTGRQLAALGDSFLVANREKLTGLYSVDDMMGLFSINLPTNETDNVPRMGVYRDSLSGGTITFSPADSQLAKESAESSEFPIRPICQADIRIVYEVYDRLPEKSERMLVEQRGNGIVTLYHTVSRRGDEEGERIFFPEYRNIIVYVYPDGDSLMTSCGYEKTKRIYRYKN